MRYPITCLLALMLAGCAGVQPLYFRAVNHSVPAVEVTSVQYSEASKQTLDVYRPRHAQGPAPVVLFFYGGTWRDGHREYYRFVGEALSRHGLLVLIPDYRKAPADVFPAFMASPASSAAVVASAANSVHRSSSASL